MSETTAPAEVDTDGAEFEDGAEYADRHGDTWRAVFEATEFRHVSRADEDPVDQTCNRWFEDINSVARDFGPMEKVRSLCAECPTSVPVGTTYCSTRCRNAADRHDEMDGDL